MQRTESTASMSDNGELVKDFEQGWHCFSTYQLNTDPVPETFVSPGDFFSGKKKLSALMELLFKWEKTENT